MFPADILGRRDLPGLSQAAILAIEINIV